MKTGYHKGTGMATIVVPLVMSVLLVVVSLPNIQCASYQKATNNPCALSETEPNMDDLMKQVKNFPSANNTALANMIGYLHFHNKGYLPLVLSKFDVDEQKALLASECATLSWNYRLTGSIIHLNDLYLEVPTEDVVSGGNGSHHTCLTNRYNYIYPPEDRFSCITKIRGGCRSKKGESLVDIVMGSLELELLGNPSNIRKGKFSSKWPAYESCYLFN